MRVIVTGANSYLGAYVCEALRDQEHDVVCVSRSPEIKKIAGYESLLLPSRPSEWYEFFYSIKGDALINLPAISSKFELNEEVCPDLISINITLPLVTAQALKAGQKDQNKNFPVVLAGSYWQNSNGNYNVPLNLYAASKSAVELLFEGVINEGFRYLVKSLRLGDVYGPLDPRPKFIYKIIKSFLLQDKLEASKGEQDIDLLYVEDAARAFAVALIDEAEVEPSVSRYSVSGGEIGQLREVEVLLSEITGKNPVISWGSVDPPGPINHRAVTFQPLPNWKPTTSKLSGLTKVVDSLSSRQ